MIDLDNIDDKMISSCIKLIECSCHKLTHANNDNPLFDHRIKVTLIGIPNPSLGLDISAEATEYAEHLIESFRRLYRLRNYDLGFRIPLGDNPITFTFRSYRSFPHLGQAELKLVKFIMDVIDKYPNTYCRLDSTRHYAMKDFMYSFNKKNFQGIKLDNCNKDKFIFRKKIS